MANCFSQFNIDSIIPRVWTTIIKPGPKSWNHELTAILLVSMLLSVVVLSFLGLLQPEFMVHVILSSICWVQNPLINQHYPALVTSLKFDLLVVPPVSLPSGLVHPKELNSGPFGPVVTSTCYSMVKLTSNNSTELCRRLTFDAFIISILS